MKMLDSYWFIILVVPLIKLLLVASATNYKMAAPEKIITPKMQQHDINSGLLSIYLLADHDAGFLGYDLLQSCTANSLHYDKELAIFHKYYDNQGTKIKCFSIAKASKPGTFDMDSLGGAGSNGIVCFIDIKKLGKYAPQFYDDFIKTLEGLQSNLGGRLYDKYKNPINNRVLDQWREYAKVICRRYGTTDFFQ